MEQHETDSPPKRRLQKKSSLPVLLLIFLLVLAVAGVLFLFFPEQARELSSLPQRFQTEQQRVEPAQEEWAPPAAVEYSASPAVPNRTVEKQPAEQDAANSAALGADPVVAGQSAPPAADAEADAAQDTAACGEACANVEEFFSTLDTRDYMQHFDVETPSRVYFPQLMQRLVDNPPVVTGETDDLFTILQNTAHFFRIIGKKNVLILKGILDREKDTFEQVLTDLYQLSDHPEWLQDQFDLAINDEAIYQYASFFLNTMGGRLYLFRRDSMSRMVVNYYAILVVDEANRQGRNKHGIPLNTAIDSLIGEIETSNANLQMRETYLDTLYRLKEKYQ